MLISFDEINYFLTKHNHSITGVLHVGAHECEELFFYNKLGIANRDVVWIDAIPQKVEQCKERGIPNVYNAIITDKDNEDISFNISNNGQSSSVLELGTHAQEHPHVVYIGKIEGKSVTIDTFFQRNNIDSSKCNFWNFDIQGAELMALKGAMKSIQHVDALYLEVNQNELYKGCALIGEIDEYLAQLGFKRVITRMAGNTGWGDAFYMK